MIMAENRQVLLANVLLAVVFLIYLCILDLLFIFVMKEQKSVINDMGLFIVSMPFIGGMLTFKLTKNIERLRVRMVVSTISFITLVIIGFLEFLWVATHFHTMLGGKI